MTTKHGIILILAALSVSSCVGPEKTDSQQLESSDIHQLQGNTIYIVRPDEDPPWSEPSKSLVVTLQNSEAIVSMSDSAYLLDKRTGQLYEVPYFREILDGRLSARCRYILRLYEDNKLYSLDPE